MDFVPAGKAGAGNDIYASLAVSLHSQDNKASKPAASPPLAAPSQQEGPSLGADPLPICQLHQQQSVWDAMPDAPHPSSGSQHQQRSAVISVPGEGSPPLPLSASVLEPLTAATGSVAAATSKAGGGMESLLEAMLAGDL